MKTKLLLFCVLVAIGIKYPPAAKAQAVNVTDSLALVDLYKSTNGPNWTNHTNWLTKPVNQWFGITVTSTRVTAVQLVQNGLDGFIPSSFGNLSKLDFLSVVQNPLGGSIPESFGNLTALTYVNLGDNHFTGGIPSSIGNLTNLVYLTLSGNPLGGTIPSSIGNLTNLKELYFISDSLGGAIPESIGNLTRLTSLQLHKNQLTGSLPASIGNLVNVVELTLDNNAFTGDVTAALGHLKNVVELNLSFNQLSGIPAALFNTGNFKSLEVLYLNDNQLSGSIPVTVGNLPRMVYLLLYNNKLSDTIPASIGQINTLNGLYLSNNQLTGSLPQSLGKLANLGQFVADYNQLTGGIPKSLDRIPELSKFTVSHNHLSIDANVTFPQLNKPDFTGDISYNNFTFNGLEFVQRKLRATIYSPQAPIAIHRHNNALAVYAGGTLSNNTYKWFRTGSTDSTVITGDSTFQPVQSGMYYVNVTNAVAKKLTLMSDTVSYTAQLANNTKAVTISVYPNPVSSALTINGLDKSGVSNIAVIDLSGNVWVKTIARRQSAIKVDVSVLKPGNYVVKVSNGNSISAAKFMKE